MTGRSPPRLAVIFDAAEERWPSMDLVAEMLLAELQRNHRHVVHAEGLHPRFVTLFEAFPGLSERLRFNLNRAATRFLTYPVELLPRRARFDLFHVADHSYGQLAHLLPASRTGVFCHDLNAFSSLLAPGSQRPAQWRKAMAWAQLRGLQRAAVVFYSTEQVRAELLDLGLVDPERLVKAPYGVAPEFWNSTGGESELPAGALPDRPFLLHVGSSVPRKRLDVLFRVFGALHERRPELVLVQQGAHLHAGHRKLIADLGIADAVIQPPPLTRRALAALYRSAALVLLPSEKEGFGLPVIEALAAGATVVASEIPAFREVAHGAVVYCRVGDIEEWVETVTRLLEDPGHAPPRAVREARARHFTWERHAQVIADTYASLLEGSRPESID